MKDPLVIGVRLEPTGKNWRVVLDHGSDHERDLSSHLTDVSISSSLTDATRVVLELVNVRIEGI